MGYKEFMESTPTVKEWLEKRPENTRRIYASKLRDFCEFANTSPEKFQRLDRKDARNIAWKYIKTLIDKPSVATMAMAALKSFYRNHDGETLPFDSSRGGKHYFNNLRRKKASYEKVPTKEEVYQIADMATSLRDRAIILTLFQSGMRVNALCNLKYGYVKYQLEQSKVPLRLRITDEIDTKLRGYRIDFYDTFISKEAIDALKKYCELYHRNSTDDTPLFLSKRGRPIGQVTIWSNFKKCIRRAGFDKKTMWVHSLRKAFKKQVRKSDVNHDFAEAIMGHVLKGAQENYFSRNDTEDIEREYSKTDFSREGNLQPIQQELETMKSDREVLESITLQQQSQIDAMKTELSDKYLNAKTFLDEIEDLRKEIEEMKKQQ